MYFLKSLNSEQRLEGGFYSQEIEPVRNDQVHRIIVLRRKVVNGRLKLYVRYEGYDERHQEWINAEDVVQDLRNA